LNDPLCTKSNDCSWPVSVHLLTGMKPYTSVCSAISSVIDLDAEIPDCAFKFRVAK